MKKYFHQKLVRDRLPEIIETTGNRCEFRIIPEEEFEKELRKKIIEEASELRDIPKEKLPKELADILEIIESIAKVNGINLKAIKEMQRKRRKEKGGFKKRIYLIWSTQPADR